MPKTYTTRHTDPSAEGRIRDALTPKPERALPPNSINGEPSARRAYPGRDANLAKGMDPNDPTKRRPSGSGI